LHILFTTFICASAAVACADPLVAERRESLGGEEPAIDKGPLHRPGQPCTWCHDGSYKVEFAVAGTVYTTIDAKYPVPGAQVTVTDSTGATKVVVTNCRGNFYIFAADWRPSFPLRTSIAFGGQTQKMESLIQREASCAACHSKQASPSSAGAVYLWKENAPATIPGACP
jgi:hypothetical protein